MKGSNNITSRQMALFIFVAQSAIGIITLPTVLAKQTGHDGWISVILAGCISIIGSVLIMMLLNRYSDKGIYEINNLIFGKYIGYGLNIVLLIYIILSAAISVRIFSLFLRLTLLPRTPPLVMSPFILLPSVYLVWQGLKNVCRFKYVSLLSFISLILYLALVQNEVKLSFLMPIGEAGIHPIMSSIRPSLMVFVGFELVAFLYPNITDKKSTLKWIIIANVTTMAFIAVVVAATTAIFGEKLLKTFSVSLFNLSRIYHAPIIERVDLYFAGLWFVAMGCAMRAYMYTGFYSLEKLKLFKKTKPLLIAFFILLIFLSRIPRDINDVFLYFDRISQIGIGVILWTILCLGLSFIIKKGVKSVGDT